MGGAAGLLRSRSLPRLRRFQLRRRQLSASYRPQFLRPSQPQCRWTWERSRLRLLAANLHDFVGKPRVPQALRCKSKCLLFVFCSKRHLRKPSLAHTRVQDLPPHSQNASIGHVTTEVFWTSCTVEVLIDISRNLMTAIGGGK